MQLEIKNHVFFSPINWDDLYHKRITPPFNPNVVSGYLSCYLPYSSSQGIGAARSKALLQASLTDSEGY